MVKKKPALLIGPLYVVKGSQKAARLEVISKFKSWGFTYVHAK